MADLKDGGRQFKPLTLDKFKGINIKRRDGSGGAINEAYGLDEALSPEMSNFNVDTEGHLTKRRGLVKVATFTGLTNNYSRIMGMQRFIDTQKTVIHVADGGSTWRCQPDGTDIAEVRKDGAGGPVTASYEYTTPYTNSSDYGTVCIIYGIGAAQQATGGLFVLYGGYSPTPLATGRIANSPVGTSIVFFKRRYWAINTIGGLTNNDESRLWFSQPDDATNWGGAGLPNNILFDKGGGDFTVAIIAYNDQLLVFLTRKTYVLTAEGDPTGWTVRLVSDRIGCIGRKTVKSINGFIYFLSHDGVYKTDGTTFELISQPINEQIDSTRDFKNPASVYDGMASFWDGKYILWVKNPDEANAVNIALVYDIESQIWTKWHFPGRSFLSEIRYPDLYPDTLFLSEAGSKILWKMGPAVFSDDGAAIQSKWVSKKMFFATPMQKTRNHLFGVSVRDDGTGGTGTGGTWSVKIKSDDRDPGSYQVQNPASLSVANLKFRGAGYGRYFQTEIVHTGTAFTKIYDMTWMNEDRGNMPASGPIKNS